MKWKIRKPKAKPISPNPNIGDTKVIKKFAWLPKKHKDYRYWLHFYQEVYEWETFDYWEKAQDERFCIEGGWNKWVIEKFGVLKKFTKTDWKLIETRF
jgi:hypothetical protein